jgi:D-3-phosphoglycerate dehydrogenase
MARILIADALAESAVQKMKDAGLEIVLRNKEEDGPIEEQIKGFDCVVIRSATKMTKDVIAAADNLKLIVRAGVGLDNVDQEAAKTHGVKVMNTPEAPSVSVAEMVFALMFALARKVPVADSSMKDERWEKMIVKKDRPGREEEAKKLGAIQVELDEMIAQADYLTMNVPMSPETKGMIGDDQFKRMKKTAYVINTARGGVVDEAALLRALDEGLIAGAALDVYTAEPPTDWKLVKHPKLIATPHLASSTKEAQVRVGELTAEKVINEFK